MGIHPPSTSPVFHRCAKTRTPLPVTVPSELASLNKLLLPTSFKVSCSASAWIQPKNTVTPMTLLRITAQPKNAQTDQACARVKNLAAECTQPGGYSRLTVVNEAAVEAKRLIKILCSVALQTVSSWSVNTKTTSSDCRLPASSTEITLFLKEAESNPVNFKCCCSFSCF